MPAKPMMIPRIAFAGIFCDLNSPMNTNHNGNIAPMMEPKPAEIYFTPQVDSPLESMKFKKLSMSIGPHSLPLGHILPLLKKKITYAAPPNNCRRPAICMGGRL